MTLFVILIIMGLFAAILVAEPRRIVFPCDERGETDFWVSSLEAQIETEERAVALSFVKTHISILRKRVEINARRSEWAAGRIERLLARQESELRIARTLAVRALVRIGEASSAPQPVLIVSQGESSSSPWGVISNYAASKVA